MTVALTNFSVSTMNEKFTLLILADDSRGGDSLGLSLVNGGEAGIARSANSPFAFDWDDMLIL